MNAVPEAVRSKPLQLTPIPWGKPDPLLGRGLCRHIVDVTPPVLIPFNPRTHAGLHRVLRSLRIFYY